MFLRCARLAKVAFNLPEYIFWGNGRVTVQREPAAIASSSSVRLEASSQLVFLPPD